MNKAVDIEHERVRVQIEAERHAKEGGQNGHCLTLARAFGGLATSVKAKVSWPTLTEPLNFQNIKT